MISTVNEAAQLLLQARVNCAPLLKLPDDCAPKDKNEAYKIQYALVDHMLAMFEGRKVGYKVACTNESA